MFVSIVIPYIRPDKWARCVELIKATAGYQDYEILSFHDTERIGCPKGVAKLVAESSGDAIAFLGDDCLPQMGFLQYAVNDMLQFDDGWGLVGFNDMTGRILPTHWLAHKRLLDPLGGEFFHTGYIHCCCDVELLERCQAMDRFLYSDHAIVLHDHPLLHGEPLNDPDYERVYSLPVRNRDRELLSFRRAAGWPIT